MRSLAVLSALLGVLALGGCGDDDTTTVTVRETVTETATTTQAEEAGTAVKVYFLDSGKVAPVSRRVLGPMVGAAAVRELLDGPTSEDPDLRSAIPSGTRLESLVVADGVASVRLSQQLTDDAAFAQLVYTLTQFPTVDRVDYGADAPRGRRAFEEQTPAILVESPLAGEEVESGFEASGTANTFEANFQYELRGADDGILTKNFVTATSGSGTRGTFSFTVAYEVPSPQAGRLVVFEISAEDGSRTNERSIPLTLR